MTIRIRLALAVCAATLWLPSLTWAVPLPPDAPKLPLPLRKLPQSTALFVHLDVAQLWDHPKAKPIRTVLFEKWDEPAEEMRRTLGVDVADLKSFTAILSMSIDAQGRSPEATAVFFTTRKPLDRKAVASAWRADPKYLEADEIPDVVPLANFRSQTLRFLGPNAFSVISEGLDEEYAETQPFPEGREPLAIREAASDRNAAVVWFNLARMNDAMPPRARNQKDVQAFLPLLACREALLTGQIGEEVRAQGRLIVGRTDPEEAEKGANALKEFAIQTITKEQAQMKGRDPDRFAVMVQLMELMIESLKTVEIKREGDVITAKGRLAMNDDFVAKLGKAVEAQVNGRLPARRGNNLKQIGLAMHNYHDAYNQFPAAGTLDKNGKPKLSWRVAVLPYLEQEQLYNQFKLDEAWDSEHNLKLLKKMPDVYALPGVTKPGDTKTHYRVFVPAAGNKANVPMFDRTNGARFADITDGTSNTIMVAEAAEAVPWTKPEPLEYDAKKAPPKLFFDEHGRGGILLGDGSTRMLKKTVKADTLHKLITRSGGEVLNPDELE